MRALPGTPAASQLVQSVHERFSARDTGLAVKEDELDRSEPYEQRRPKQIQLRPFPTTSVRTLPWPCFARHYFIGMIFGSACMCHETVCKSSPAHLLL